MKELRIKDICVKGSSNLKQKDVEGKNGDYPVYGASGVISHIDTYHQETNYIAIVKDGSGIGRVSFMPAKSSVIGTLQYILPKDGFDINYVGYCLKSLDLSNYKQGAAIPHIYFRDYGERIVHVTDDLAEQQSIVEYLETSFAKIDTMKANAEKALNEAKALFQSSLKELLTPKEEVTMKSVGDLFETYSGGTPTKSHKEYYGGTIPWLRSGEVCTKDILSTEMFITEKGLKESSAKYYPENTVVVAMYGATAAQVGILRLKATSNQAVCGILPNKDFLPEFIYYWFLAIQDDLASQAQGGAQPNISQQKIKKVLVPIYSLQEQKSIVETLDSIKVKADNLQNNYDKISQECDTLKQSILKQVFE